MARKKRGAKLPLPIALLLALLLAGAYYYFQPALPTAPPLALPTVPEPSALTGPSAPPAELQTENWAAGQGLVTLHSIDVGQGDATLLVFPNGKTLLVDAGNNGKGKAIILPYFEKLGIEQIDWLVATNPDADHVGGMDDVINEIPVKNFLDPGVACATKTCLANDAALARAGITKTFAHRGEALNLGDGFKVGILNPVKPLAFDKENNNSIVLFVDTQGKDFLLPGDCEKECEAQLVEAYGDKLKAGLYKAGHHGSRTSSSEGTSRQRVSASSISASVGAPKDRAREAASCTASTTAGWVWPATIGPHEPR